MPKTPGRLTRPSYFGGKSNHVGAWIAAQLPWDRQQTYIETHGGMYGVGLLRPPPKLEIFNDLDGRIVNWWRVCRDRPAELQRLLDRTEQGRAVYAEAATKLDDPNPVVQAWAVTVVLDQGFLHSLAHCTPGTWSLIASDRGRGAQPLDIHRLAARMRRVQLEQRPAVDLLDRVSAVDEAMIYVDPPYGEGEAVRSGDASGVADLTDLTGVLLAQSGTVAVSGYGSEWDHLGWRRETKTVRQRTGTAPAGGGGRASRTEVLWLNFPPAQRDLFGGGRAD